MGSTSVVERFIREAWVRGDSGVMTETVSSNNVKNLFELFNSAFTDVELKALGPVFSDAQDSMVAFYGEMHLRQIATFLHVSAIGRQADVGFTGIFRTDEGRIAQMWVEMDFAALYSDSSSGV